MYIYIAFSVPKMFFFCFLQYSFSVFICFVHCSVGLGVSGPTHMIVPIMITITLVRFRHQNYNLDYTKVGISCEQLSFSRTPLSYNFIQS